MNSTNDPQHSNVTNDPPVGLGHGHHHHHPGDMTGFYGYRNLTPSGAVVGPPQKEVSFLEFVEVSTTDSSLSPDLTASRGSGSGHTASTTIALHSPSRPPLPNHHLHYEPLRPPAAINHPPPAINHSASISSTNSNSSNSPSPLVSLEHSLVSPPYPDGYQLLLTRYVDIFELWVFFVTLTYG